jgi:hypothetical protein
MRLKSITAALGVCSAVACKLSLAACGTSFCSVDSDWEAGELGLPGSTRMELRFEFLDQDQLRHGTHRVAAGEVPSHHDELRTINRNVLIAAERALNPSWAIAAQLPAVSRSHRHLQHHHEHGHDETIPEDWNIRAAGDLRLNLRYQSEAARTFGLGLKLPTGSYRERNAEGELAERSLQPGSGTTDGLFEAVWRAGGGGWVPRSFGVRVQAAIAARDGYRPGASLQFNAAWRPASFGVIDLELQTNATVRQRDAGAAAERDDSGMAALFASAGLSWSVNLQQRWFAYVQVPLWQRVNGVQLTADWGFVSGWRGSF